MKDSRNTYLTRKYPRRSHHGVCPLCQRETDLTFHHLIPKKMHRRNFFKKNFDKQTLASGIDICRNCHTGLHKTYDEMTLAKNFNSIDKIQNDEILQAHFVWVSKQRISK